MTRVLSAALAVSMAGLASVADAQTRWAVELRGGATQATETFTTTDLRTGGGFEGTIGVRVAPGTSIYGGWDWQHRRAGTPLLGRTTDVEDTGYVLGARIEPDIASPVRPWIRGGALYNHVEIEDESGSRFADSTHTWGWEVGGGLALPVGTSWSITPGLRYRRFSLDVRVGTHVEPATLAHVAYEVGIARRF